MKKIIYTFVVLFLVFSSLQLYHNHIFYIIPYNPLVEFSSETPISCRVSLWGADGEMLSKSSHDLNNNALIFDYFTNLKLMPVKERTKRDETRKGIRENRMDITYTFRFGSSTESFLIIREIYLDDLTIMAIRSDIRGFNNGYYRIIDSKFDYTYVNNLFDDSEK